MGLNQYYDPDYDPKSTGSGSYLEPGTHDVRVVSYRMITLAKNPGVEFTVQDCDGRTCKNAFWLTEKAMTRLCSFAAACGLNHQERDIYNPDDANCHQALVNRPLTVEIDLQDNSDIYCEFKNWRPRNAGQAPAQQVARPPAVEQPQAQATPEASTYDPDIPF